MIFALLLANYYPFFKCEVQLTTQLLQNSIFAFAIIEEVIQITILSTLIGPHLYSGFLLMCAHEKKKKVSLAFLRHSQIFNPSMGCPVQINQRV